MSQNNQASTLVLSSQTSPSAPSFQQQQIPTRQQAILSQIKRENGQLSVQKQIQNIMKNREKEEEMWQVQKKEPLCEKNQSMKIEEMQGSENILNYRIQYLVKTQFLKKDPDMEEKILLINDLLKLLRSRDIPLKYIRSLLMVNRQKQIKSTRKLKVERYLQKRRFKTWNKKICYNCRQKVAEERLRIKGKFIKKRKAMELLGLKKPVQMKNLKVKLQKMLRHKNKKEIEELIKMSDEDDLEVKIKNDQDYE